MLFPNVHLIRTPLLNIFLLKLPFPLSTIQETLLASRCPLIRIEMANAYVHSEDRQRSLAAGWLLQYVAATFLKNTQLEQIPIIEEAKTEYGRSFLPSLRSLNVSITHSGPYVACAASPHDVGIDIEKIQNCDLSQENFGFMSVPEEKTFHSLSQIKKNDFFLSLKIECHQYH